MPRDKLKKRLGDLSPRAQSIIKDRRISERQKNNLKYWLKVLKELKDFDASTDTQIERLKKLRIYYVVGAVIAIFASTFITAAYALAGAAVFGVGLVGVGLIIWSSMQIKTLNQVDLLNDLRVSLLPFLDEIVEDVPGKAKIDIRLDLRGLDDTKRVSQKEVPPGRFRKVTQSVYRDPWCAIDLPLADGGNLSLKLDNYYIMHKRQWSNSRGKSKIKYKWSKVTTLCGTLIPDPELFKWDEDHLQEFAQANKVKYRAKKGAPQCRLVRKFKFKTEERSLTSKKMPKEDSVKPTEVMAVCTQLYSLLTPLKEGVSRDV